MCPTDPEDWKKIEEKFGNKWNVAHAVSALDGKHIAIKKPKKSGNEYCNYKGYFSLVLLALVDADYKFLWVNVGASESSSDAQIFNRSKQKEELRMEPWDYYHLNHLARSTLLSTGGLWLCPYALAGQAIQ